MEQPPRNTRLLAGGHPRIAEGRDFLPIPMEDPRDDHAALALERLRLLVLLHQHPREARVRSEGPHAPGEVFRRPRLQRHLPMPEVNTVPCEPEALGPPPS